MIEDVDMDSQTVAAHFSQASEPLDLVPSSTSALTLYHLIEGVKHYY